MEKTLIQVRKSTADKLQNMKGSQRQTYDEVITRLLQEAEGEILSEEELKDIEKGLDDVRKGRMHSLQDVAKEFNVKL